PYHTPAPTPIYTLSLHDALPISQKANWARRPLTQRMETYARNDTRYLKPLADLLQTQLKEKGRLSWHGESCARLIADCAQFRPRSEEHTSELQSRFDLVCRLLLE